MPYSDTSENASRCWVEMNELGGCVGVWVCVCVSRPPRASFLGKLLVREGL